MSTDYQIKLPQFEGPFDLLLFFIERDELDIYNIPINTITKDFLQYIHQMEQLNIELASEFILFVSTLMRIKAKMLLPRKEMDEKGNEIDPRQELIDKILEYKRFKEAASEMVVMEAERLLQLNRGNIQSEMNALADEFAEGTEIQTVTVYKLMNAFDRAMKKLQERMAKPQHVIVKYNYSQEGQRNYLVGYMAEHKRLTFEGIFDKCENRIHAIFTFLAMLELVQQKFVTIMTGTGRNNFILEWNEERENSQAEDNEQNVAEQLEDGSANHELDAVTPESME